jgi:ech hydrogenase subunit E
VSYTLVLGPSHAAWRGPQRFVISVAGERVNNIEYTSEQQTLVQVERLPRLPIRDALTRISQACPTCHQAHTLAFCGAYERVCSAAIPVRARAIRCIVAELERVIAHLAGVGRILWALGMEPQHTAFQSYGKLAQEALIALSGSDSTAGLIGPGGLARDVTQSQIEQAAVLLAKLNRSLFPSIERLIDHQALLARTVEIGAVPRVAAEQYGVQGPLARASGIGRDVRIDQPYENYATLPIRVITQENGDVYARIVVLMLEAYESIKLSEQALREVPDGAWLVEVDLPELPATSSVSVTVEGPHGPIRYTLGTKDGRIAQLAVETPRQFDRLLVRTLLSGALTDDIAVIIASANQCITCSAIQ